MQQELRAGLVDVDPIVRPAVASQEVPNRIGGCGSMGTVLRRLRRRAVTRRCVTSTIDPTGIETVLWWA